MSTTGRLQNLIWDVIEGYEVDSDGTREPGWVERSELDWKFDDPRLVDLRKSMLAAVLAVWPRSPTTGEHR